MGDFAKTFNHPKHGQILVKIDESDAGPPEVRFYAQPPDLGVCSIALGFDIREADVNDPDIDAEEAAWGRAETFFEKVDRNQAEKFVDKLVKPLGLFGEPS